LTAGNVGAAEKGAPAGPGTGATQGFGTVTGHPRCSGRTANRGARRARGSKGATRARDGHRVRQGRSAPYYCSRHARLFARRRAIDRSHVADGGQLHLQPQGQSILRS
jgi:hypothetical protein